MPISTASDGILQQIEPSDEFRGSFDLLPAHRPATPAGHVRDVVGVQALRFFLQNPDRFRREAQLDVIKRRRAQDLSNSRPNPRGLCRVLRVQKTNPLSPLVGQPVVEACNLPTGLVHHFGPMTKFIDESAANEISDLPGDVVGMRSVEVRTESQPVSGQPGCEKAKFIAAAPGGRHSDFARHGDKGSNPTLIVALYQVEGEAAISLEPSHRTMASSSDMARKHGAITVTASSGNVFADIGLPNADQELLKAQLTTEIYRIITRRKLTRTQAGTILRITQPDVALLMRNRSGTLSAEQLLSFLASLGCDVEIRIKRTRKSQGQLSVVAAA